MAYSDDLKTRASELYMQLGNIPLVHQKLCDEYGDGVPKEITIRKWVDKNNLVEVRKNLNTDALVHARTTALEDTLRRQEEHKDKYKLLIEKASEQLFGEEQLRFHTAMDATRAMDMGIQGEKKITDAQFNIQFVEDLFTAVSQIVTDIHQRREIGMAFRKIVSKYSELY
jgi:hypothetical protein